MPFRRFHPLATSLQVLVSRKGLDSSSMRSPVHLLSLLAFHALVAPFASAALAPHRPLLRPGAALTPACSSDLNDLSRQWLVQELESELLVEERAPSKQIGGDIRHTRSFPYMTRIGPVHPTYLRRSPYVSKVATPSRATSCRMMARGKPGAKTTRRASRRATSKTRGRASTARCCDAAGRGHHSLRRWRSWRRLAMSTSWRHGSGQAGPPQEAAFSARSRPTA